MIHPWRKAAALAVFSLSAAALAQSPVPPAGAKPAAQSAAKPAAPVAKAAAPAENPDAIRVLLTPELETTLVAQMVGRISSLKAELGGKVQKGKAVIGFDCGEAAARLNMAQAHPMRRCHPHPAPHMHTLSHTRPASQY